MRIYKRDTKNEVAAIASSAHVARWGRGAKPFVQRERSYYHGAWQSDIMAW